jgi:hypothetical protein
LPLLRALRIEEAWEIPLGLRFTSSRVEGLGDRAARSSLTYHPEFGNGDHGFHRRHGFRDAYQAYDEHPSGESIKRCNSLMIRVSP